MHHAHLGFIQVRPCLPQPRAPRLPTSRAAASGPPPPRRTYQHLGAALPAMDPELSDEQQE
eukprot:11170988-Lingulodinium_polyedra.AAC.1